MTDSNININSKLNSVIKNPKRRLIIAAAVVVVILGGVIGYWHHRSSENKMQQGHASVLSAPNIESIPGTGNPSNQYIGNQNLQNQLKELQARKNATSAVPTITRPNFIGNPSAFGELPTQTTNLTGMSRGNSKECPIKKVVVMYKPNPASCSLDNLILARRAGVTAEELVCQGCSCPILKDAGYTAGDLKAIGYSAKQLRQCGFTLGQLVAAGYSATDLKNAGYDAKQLANVGFTAGQLAAAGFTPKQVDQAGYTQAQLTAAGLSSGTDCSVSALQEARLAGVTAAQLREEGCGLAALKAAGFTPKQLKDAGFSAQQLKDTGFSAGDLKKPGFTAGQLKNAGFDNDALQAAGFTPAEITAADKNSNYCNLEHLKKLRAEGISAYELKKNGCGLAALKAAGYTAGELKAAGFSARALKDAGFTPAQLKAAGFNPADLKKAGFNAVELKSAGFPSGQLKDAGFSAAQLKKTGFSAAKLAKAGFSAKQLSDAGFNANALKAAGFDAGQLKNAGFNAGRLKTAGFGATPLKNVGFTAKQLHDAGFSAAALKNAGFTPKQLLAGEYTKGDLLRGGFTPAQAGYHLAPTVAARPPANSVNGSHANTTNSTGVGTSGMGAGASMPSINGNTPEARLAQLARLEQHQMNQQQYQDSLQQMQGAMTMQAQTLLGGWSNNSTQTLNQAPQAAINNEGNGQGNGGYPFSTGKIIKAGTVMYAVLKTSINSDEQTPIMAKIVMGPLKGSVLLGRFQRVNKKLLLSFNLLNDPHYNRSLSMNSVAIDPDTARTALSGMVNNHYLLRYGTLFASAFLQGFSNAVIASTTQTHCLFGGFLCSTRSKLNTPQQIAVGLGSVGEQYADKLGDNFYRPPTVQIPGGTGIGVLMMSDLTLPAQQNAAVSVPSTPENAYTDNAQSDNL